MQRRQACALSRWWDGLADQNSLRAWMPEVFADMLRWGLGIIHVEGDITDKVIKLSRVIPDELRIDPADAMMGLRHCRRIYRVRFVAKSVLVAKYPEHKDAIWASSAATPGALAGFAGIAQVESPDEWAVVIEGYARGTKKDPGRFTIIIGSNVVVHDDQKFTRSIPYAFLPGYPTGTLGVAVRDRRADGSVCLARQPGALEASPTRSTVAATPSGWCRPGAKVGSRPRSRTRSAFKWSTRG